jgi:hypothetical protein
MIALMTLSELIGILERAGEGSSELDALIGGAVFDGDDRDALAAIRASRGNDLKIEALARLPCYTRSLDAALALVPAGWSWQVSVLYRNEAPAPAIRAAAFHERAGMVLTSEYCEAEAGTAPLALCIAALRVRCQSLTREAQRHGEEKQESPQRR